MAISVAFAGRPDVGIVGARIWSPRGFLLHGGVLLRFRGRCRNRARSLPRGVPGYFGRANCHQSFCALTGGCLMVRKELFERVGGFDVGLSRTGQDIDLCLRIRRAGYRNVWTELVDHRPRPEVLLSEKDTQQLKEKWGAHLRCPARLFAESQVDE
jgi:hypothetical protein